MTSKERMLTAMRNGKPDMVPVAPDISNMVPCQLTGKPFWDIYLYQNPPLWKVYIDAVRHFGFDGWMYDVNGYTPYVSDASLFGDEPVDAGVKTETVIVMKTDERIVTRKYTQLKGKPKQWSPHVTVYYRWDPPTFLLASKIGLDAPPDEYWPLEVVEPEKKGLDLFREIKEYMGDDGVIGFSVGCPALGNPELGIGYSIYDYCDRYEEVKKWSIRADDQARKRLRKLLASPVKPDFVLTGGSGLLIFNTPKILRDITLPTIQKITKMCRDAGMVSQIHCCGPERALVEMCAHETDLDSINPLEIRPMGDCELAEIKRSFGKKLSLMGNLHTTEVMLRGSAKDVEEASKKAIDDAAEGGGFILSTGDQCGRDTPEENIFKMIEVARTYGKY